jgi:hypothetical protein
MELAMYATIKRVATHKVRILNTSEHYSILIIRKKNRLNIIKYNKAELHCIC